VAERYEAVLFDFDGVVVDSEPVHYACWTEILSDYGLILDWDFYCRECIGVADREMLARLRTQRNPPIPLEQLIGEYPRKKQMFRERMLAGDHVSAAIRELLADLRDAGYRLAVVTSSGKPEVEPILAAAGILDYFGAAVYARDVPRLKPAPDPYLEAARRLGVRRALVVEDSDAGEASGRAAGFDVLRVASSSEVVDAVRRRVDLSAATTRYSPNRGTRP
jgi:HAD superfamily hydrolase (TIGR01509 family)